MQLSVFYVLGPVLAFSGHTQLLYCRLNIEHEYVQTLVVKMNDFIAVCLTCYSSIIDSNSV